MNVGVKRVADSGEMVALVLRAWPISANDRLTYRSGSDGTIRFITSDRYRGWQQVASLELRPQVRKLNGVVFTHPRVEIGVFEPNKIRRDLDNLIKPVLDMLVYEQVLTDDCGVQAIEIRKLGVVPGGKLVITVRETR